MNSCFATRGCPSHTDVEEVPKDRAGLVIHHIHEDSACAICMPTV